MGPGQEINHLLKELPWRQGDVTSRVPSVPHAADTDYINLGQGAPGDRAATGVWDAAMGVSW